MRSVWRGSLHHSAGGQNRGRWRRLTDSSVQGFQYAAHFARERFDLLQARHGLRVVLLGAQEQQLCFGEDGGERVREVVPQLPDWVRRVRHLQERAVEIAQMMVAQ